MDIGAGDRELIAVMRRYFAAKVELESVKRQLEAARQAQGQAIAVLYEPRRNLDHAGELQRSHRLKGEMVSLMQRAEAWGRAELAAGGATRFEAGSGGEEPSDTLSFAGVQLDTLRAPNAPHDRSSVRRCCSNSPPASPTCATTAASLREAECRGWRPRSDSQNASRAPRMPLDRDRLV